MSIGRCPLPPDPGYESTSNYYTCHTYEGQPVGRIRPEAQEIAKRHTAGIISMLLTSEPHQPPLSSRRPIKKNHLQANKKRIKELQVRCQSRQRESNDSQLLPPRVDRYSHVPAKVTPHLGKPCRYSVTDTIESPKVKAKEKENEGFVTHRYLSSRDCDAAQYTSDHFTVNSTDKIKSKRNFLAENITGVSQYKRKQPPKQVSIQMEQDKREKDIAAHQKGVIPQYLVQRKEQWKREEEERQASMPDPSIPPEHILMPKHEQQQTLQLLRQHREKLLEELHSLPLTADTLRVTSRRTQLESRLVEVEDAIEIFSRPKVFVKIDE